MPTGQKPVGLVPSLLAAEELAVAAWADRSDTPKPESVEIIYDSGFPERTVIFCLRGAGPEGTSVVAKRSPYKRARVETLVYERILPLLSLRTATYYGADHKLEPGFCWLFMEFVEGEPVTRAHDALVAEWLAQLHTEASALATLAELPRKGLDHYREIVTSSLRQIAKCLEQDEVEKRQRDVLSMALEDFELLDQFWPDLAELCAELPETLLHGNFLPRNLLLDAEGRILGLDWENSGWGRPAVDLALVDAHHYAESVCARWPQLSLARIERAAGAGHVFAQIARMARVTERLPDPRTISRLRHRRAKLALTLEAIGWS